ncbi:MAG: META domain-containing protein [Alistipes sp.]
MGRFIKIVLCLSVLGLLVGCCNCKSFQKKNRRPLVGTEWQLVQLLGQNEFPAPDKFTIQFSDDNRISGVGACNRIMGAYSADVKGAMKIGPLATTMMACPGMDKEQSFTNAISQATHYEMDGSMLLLLSNGELKAIFQAKK